MNSLPFLRRRTSLLDLVTSRAMRVALLAALPLLLIAPAADAATLTWDANGIFGDGNSDGGGTWSTTAANWNNGTADVGWNNATLDIANIGSAATGGTINLGEAITVGGITINNGGYTVAGGTGGFALTLGSTAIVTANATTTINANVAGSNGLTKKGSGTLILGGANTYSGGTFIQQSSIQPRAAGALPAATTVTIGTAASSVGATLDLRNSQTIAGLAAIGTNLANETVSQSQITGATGTVLTVNPDGAATPVDSIFGGVIKSDATHLLGVTKAGSKMLTLAGANTYTGATSVKGGTLSVTGSISAASVITVGDSASLTTAAILAGTGTVGDVVLGAAASNTGATLDPGNGVAGNIGQLTVGALTQGNGAHLALQFNAATLSGNPLGGVDFDQVVTTGNVLLGSTGGGSDLSLLIPSGFAPGGDGLYFLIVNNSAQLGGIGNLGQFTSLNGLATTLGQDSLFTVNGQLFEISYNADFGTRLFDGTGNDIAVMAVPEPSAYAMVGIGAIWLFVSASRRRRG